MYQPVYYGYDPVMPVIPVYPARTSPSRAVAELAAGPIAPNIRGYVYFVDVPHGTEVYVQVTGLPAYRPAAGDAPPVGPHGFHLHAAGSCEIGNPKDPFQAAGTHWNPDNQPHGNHAGDFPDLFSNAGYAKMSFFTNRFRVADIIGQSVIIHQNPDDHRSQPTGNAGKRLACGVIKAV